MEKRLPPTYTHVVIHTIMPAPGWQAVFWDAERHVVEPLHALALVSRRYYDRDTHDVCLRAVDAPREDEDREVLGLMYGIGEDCFHLVDTFANFCGLMPPEADLAKFEERHTCYLARQAAKEVPA